MYDQHPQSPQEQQRNAVTEGITWIANLTAFVACLLLAPYFFKFTDTVLAQEIASSYGEDSLLAGIVHMLASVSLLATIFMVLRSVLILSFSTVVISVILRIT